MILCKAYLISCPKPLSGITFRAIAGIHYLHSCYDYFISDNLYIESCSDIYEDTTNNPIVTKELVKKYYKLENEVL